MVKVSVRENFDFFATVYMNDARIAFIANGHLTFMPNIKDFIVNYSQQDWEQVIRDIAPVIAKQLKASMENTF